MKQKLLIFFLIGIFIFLIDITFNEDSPNKITIYESELDSLINTWVTQVGREPTNDEIDGIIKQLIDEENSLLNAIEKPFCQILKNAGIEKHHTILSEVERGFNGYNIQTGEYVDMIEKGIIDPTKVTRTALENAVSVAGTMLITECTIVDDPEEKKEDSMPMMGM